MPTLEVIALVSAAVAAGAINAVAGGGTLVTFPTLLLLNTPAVVANATSTVALVIGTAGSVFGYRQHLKSIRIWLWRFVPVSVLGGWIGSALLTRTTESTFSRLVPFLILFATVVFVAQGAFRQFAKSRPSRHDLATPTRLWVAITFQFLVSIYGGYFGAGIGILMLASLGFLGLGNIHEMNALKTVLGSLINLVAAVWFILSGLIHWPKALIMAVGALAGYFLGSHFSQRIPQAQVRRIITLIGFALSAITFYQEFVR
jgi:uncharacterized membrane protein YfcA